MPRSFQHGGIVAQKVLAASVRLGLRNRSILIAVSGGGDSVALLEVLADLAPQLGLKLAVATVDHGLRDEARAEALEVARKATARGLPFHLESIRCAGGPGVEARARTLRYAALESVRERHGYELIATAHSASDQAETLLMRLARGSSLGGAAGVLARRGRIVRPLLSCTREEVRAFLEERGLTFTRDPMNDDPAFLRVRVRKDVLPRLEEAAGAGATERLARFAEFAREDDALLARMAEGALRRARVGEGAWDAVSLRALEGPIRRRVFASLCDDAGLVVDAACLERMETALADGATATLASGAVLRAEGGVVRIETPSPIAPAGAGAGFDEPLRLDGPAVIVPGFELRWRSERVLSGADAQPIAPTESLRVRYRQPGDRVRVNAAHSRKLQDVLIDAKVPSELRDRVPLVVDAAGEVRVVVGLAQKSANLEMTADVTWLICAAMNAEQAPGGAVRYKDAEQGTAADVRDGK